MVTKQVDSPRTSECVSSVGRWIGPLDPLLVGRWIGPLDPLLVGRGIGPLDPLLVGRWIGPLDPLLVGRWIGPLDPFFAQERSRNACVLAILSQRLVL